MHKKETIVWSLDPDMADRLGRLRCDGKHVHEPCEGGSVTGFSNRCKPDACECEKGAVAQVGLCQECDRGFCRACRSYDCGCVRCVWRERKEIGRLAITLTW